MESKTRGFLIKHLSLEALHGRMGIRRSPYARQGVGPTILLFPESLCSTISLACPGGLLASRELSTAQ
eukprot:3476579-Amphidinium_carterae.1